MSLRVKPIEELNILSERLCLDFVNTVSWHLSDVPYDWLHNYEDLIAWSQRVKILSTEKANHLKALAESSPERTAKVFADAIRLRDTMYRIFQNRVQNKQPNQVDLDIINQHVGRAYPFLQLKTGETEMVLGFNDRLEPDCMVWEIVRSTVEFLTSSELAKLKLCEGGQCGWVFLDTTKNHSRRWCSMGDCGNRAKARRHYQKKQKGHNDR